MMGSPRTAKFSCLAPISMWSMSGSISALDNDVSLQNLASRSGQYAGNAFLLESVAAGCHCSKRPCYVKSVWSSPASSCPVRSDLLPNA